MTEAEQRNPAARGPDRWPPVSGPALGAGIALGTFLAIEAVRHGVILPLFSGFANGLLTFFLFIVAGMVLAELTRRHHRTVARHGWRHGKRGASAAYRGARKHGARGARFAAGKARAQWAAWRTPPGDPASSDDDLYAAFSTPGGQDTAPPASTKPPTEGNTSMPASPSKITPDRRARRTAARSSGSIPSEWGPVVAQAADFEPESDGHLLDWMAGQVTGMAAYAEGLIEAYETGVGAVGIDPKGLAALHDVADAAAHAAETMSGASRQFAEHYELPREFAANGGLMTHDGRWITGDGA